MRSITKLTKIDFLIVKATKKEENFDSSNHWDDLTMPYYYYLASILFGILGLAFLMVWIGDRLNRAALLWGIAHLNLGVASLTGYQYQHSQWFPLALVSLVSTALFLVLLLTGTQALIGRIQKWRFIGQQTILMTITIGIIGFGMSQDIARFLVSLLMMMIYLWAGFTFARQQKEYWIVVGRSAAWVPFLCPLTKKLGCQPSATQSASSVLHCTKSDLETLTPSHQTASPSRWR